MKEVINKPTANKPAAKAPATDFPAADFYEIGRSLVSNGADATLSCAPETPARFDITGINRATRLKSEFMDGRPTGKLIASPCIEVSFSDGFTIKTYPTSPKKDGAFNPNGRPCLAPVFMEDAGIHWLALTKR